MSRHFLPLSLLIAMVVACGRPPEPRNPEPKPFEAPKEVLDTEDEGREKGPIRIDVDEAGGQELLSVVEQAINKPVLVHATAIPALALCERRDAHQGADQRERIR